MKSMTLLAATLCLLGSEVRADDSCTTMLKRTDAAERALNAPRTADKVSKAVLRAAARDLEIATTAARTCRAPDARLRLAAVRELLSNLLLAASDDELSSY